MTAVPFCSDDRHSAKLGAAISVALYSRGESGHRKAYLRFVSDLFGTRHRVKAAETLTTRHRVFFLMVEDSFALYVAAALFRSLWGRRTVGLLFRPGPALEGMSLRLRSKRLVLKLLKALPHVRTLTIVPFSVAPRFSEIADDWIYDFQFWDMAQVDRSLLSAMQDAGLKRDIKVAAKGRPVVCAIGSQDRHKGFDTFANVWSENSELRKRFLFAYGGKVSGPLKELAARISAGGGFGVDRYLTDAEILGCYSVSDAIWGLYDRTYDQASGILGRAVQFGIPMIVREGSLSHEFCVEYNVPHIAATAESVASSLDGPLPDRKPENGAALAARFRRESLKTLADALGLRGIG